MNDEQKTPAEDEQQTGTTPTAEQKTVEQPAAEPAPAPTAPAEETGTSTRTTRTRTILLTSGAGIALASGLIGFGIGYASADDGDGNRVGRTSHSAPGEGRPDLHDGQRPDGPPNGMGYGERHGDDSTDSGGQRSNGDDDPT